MNGKFTAAWNSVCVFCAEQTVSFYVGMALAVLFLLSLRTFIPFALGLALCPFATFVLYLMLRALKQPPAQWKGNRDVKRGALSSFLGGLYAVILALL